MRTRPRASGREATDERVGGLLGAWVWFASDSTPHFAAVIRPHLGACRALPGASTDERFAVQWQRYRPAASARQAVSLAEREVRDLAELDPGRVHDRGGCRAGRGGSLDGYEAQIGRASGGVGGVGAVQARGEGR